MPSRTASDNFTQLVLRSTYPSCRARDPELPGDDRRAARPSSPSARRPLRGPGGVSVDLRLRPGRARLWRQKDHRAPVLDERDEPGRRPTTLYHVFLGKERGPSTTIFLRRLHAGGHSSRERAARDALQLRASRRSTVNDTPPLAFLRRVPRQRYAAYVAGDGPLTGRALASAHRAPRPARHTDPDVGPVPTFFEAIESLRQTGCQCVDLVRGMHEARSRSAKTGETNHRSDAPMLRRRRLRLAA